MPLPSFSGDIEKNIIRHIKYRGTIRTGEIIVDNGDGTYDVKIALSDMVYPSVETIHYEMVFAAGEIAVIAFEYGNKESPKIIGHGKKIAQTPVEVEVDYSGAAAPVAAIDIDIGSPAIDRVSYIFPFTVIDKNNPANATGTITSVEIWAYVGWGDMGGAVVATFTQVDTNVFTARDRQVIGTVTAGSKQTFEVNLDVQTGDYIGIYYSSGGIEVDPTYGAGTWHLAGDQTSCSSATFTSEGSRTMSLYGTGMSL